MIATRLTYVSIVSISLIALVIGCLLDRSPFALRMTSEDPVDPAVQVVQDWYRHAMEAERYVEGFRIPVAARMYAYLGIAGYEVALWKSTTAYSLDGGQPQWVKPAPGDSVLLPVALNTCFATMMELLMLNAPHQTVQSREETRKKWRIKFEQDHNQTRILVSEKWGADVAKAVFQWSLSDTAGHMAQLHNYDKTFTLPDQDGIWKPTGEISMPPLLPHWGSVRTFVTGIEDITFNEPIEYCETKGSNYYTQIYEVYALTTPLTPENVWIAEFWSDDHPGLTFTTAGRWISIANQVVDKVNPDLKTTLETYLKTGVALSDAMVICWHGKYKYMTERPSTFIKKFIDDGWHPLHDTPSFPAYPSGHSVLAAAAAEVLTEIYGDNFKITDKSHAGRQEFRGNPRNFNSFYEMAQESAFSRMVLGVHIRSDCEEGLRLGSLIGQKIASVPIDDPFAEILY